MKHILAFVAVLSVTAPAAAQEPFPLLEGPYMGQTPPGMTPEVFLPGILKNETDGAFCTVFSPGLDEFYFVAYEREVDESALMHGMQMTRGRWMEPEPLGFSLWGKDNDMCLSADGNRMIFRSRRALPDGAEPSDHSWLWVADREDGAWGTARPLLAGGETLDSGYPSLAANGTLYFRYRLGGFQGIYRSRLVDGQYSAPEHVTTLFHGDFIHGDMFVAPDESYMIVSGRDPEERFGHGNLDLYVVFRESDGSWSSPADMGDEINTHLEENCPQVTPDGKYLFFNRYDPAAEEGNMFWVDAAVIEGLRGTG